MTVVPAKPSFWSAAVLSYRHARALDLPDLEHAQKRAGSFSFSKPAMKSLAGKDHANSADMTLERLDKGLSCGRVRAWSQEFHRTADVDSKRRVVSPAAAKALRWKCELQLGRAWQEMKEFGGFREHCSACPSGCVISSQAESPQRGVSRWISAKADWDLVPRDLRLGEPSKLICNYLGAVSAP